MMYRLILITMCLCPIMVSAQVPLGTSMPDLSLEYMRGGQTSTHALSGDQGTVLVFWSNDCNWTDQYEDRVQDLSTASIPVVLVNSNDSTVFPKESEAGKSYRVAYVRDLDAKLAKALNAERTPHVFVFDSGKRLVYSGGIDDSPADAQAVEQNWLQEVIGELSQGKAVSVSTTKSFGCRIKLP